MTLKELYAKLHGNYDDAISRLMNETLMDRFVKRFPADPSMQTLLDKIAEGNCPEAFRAVHTLKGVAANLGFTELQQNASNLTEQMRDEVSPADPQLLAKVQESYKLVIDSLSEYAG